MGLGSIFLTKCPYTFDGIHFARWKNWMTCNFKFIFPQMWWIVDVGFSHALDEKNATKVQKKCLHLDCQATNIFHQSMKDNIFGEIMDMKSAHEIWIYLNKKYGRSLMMMMITRRRHMRILSIAIIQ